MVPPHDIPDAKKLMAKYPLSERQTDAILELRLYQLTGLMMPHCPCQELGNVSRAARDCRR